MQNEESFTGSTFFSMSDSPPLLPSSDDSSEKLFEKNSYILIFTVEKDARLLLCTLLQLWNYQTQETDNLENALAIVKNRTPNLILIDSFPPFEENLEIIRQFRESKSCRNVPIIMLSGFSQSEFRSQLLAGGATDFFVKPIDFDLLKVCVEKNIKK